METPQQRSANTQPSHTLLVFSAAAQKREDEFRRWLTRRAFQPLRAGDKMLSVRHYALHPMKISEAYKPLGFSYLSLCRLCLDGAHDAAGLISDLRLRFEREACSGDIATWLFYPVGEKVGKSRDRDAPYITIAFSNPNPGCENEFREWYATQHIRHALMIPALLNGQVFEATQFQISSSSACDYTTMAIYEMGASPEALMESIPGIDAEKMAWSPAGDTEQFTECFFKLL